MSEPMKIYDGSAEAKTARKQAKSCQRRPDVL